MVEEQKSSIARLNQALADKDQILSKREGEFRAELKVARGTWLGRASRTALHVAIGIGIGLVVRRKAGFGVRVSGFEDKTHCPGFPRTTNPESRTPVIRMRQFDDFP